MSPKEWVPVVKASISSVGNDAVEAALTKLAQAVERMAILIEERLPASRSEKQERKRERIPLGKSKKS